jgi:membrane protein implicated in regulation of membrane protease activity
LNDRALGGLIFIGSVAVAAFYLWWLFLSPWQLYAVLVPVLLAVMSFLFIVAWIGWTMAMTPAPTAIEETVLEQSFEEEKPKKVEKPIEERTRRAPRRRASR